MKKRLIGTMLIGLIGAGSLFALDITSELRTGNLGFDKDATAPGSAASETYKSLLHYEGNFSVSEVVTDRFSFSAGFDRDDILRNRIFTLVGFDAGYVTLNVGPFFGPFNADDSILSSGISTRIGINLPGIIYGSFRSDSTIGAGLAAPGDYVQELSAIEMGFWVPNVIVSGKLSQKSFSYMDSATLTIVDELTRYDFNAHVFKKNVPYTVEVNLAYQTLIRSYVGATDTAKDELDSVLMGSSIAITASPTLDFYLGGEFSLYSWGVSGLKSPSTDTALFSVRIGCTWRIPRDGITEKRGSLPVDRGIAPVVGNESSPAVPEEGNATAGQTPAAPGESPAGTTEAVPAR